MTTDSGELRVGTRGATNANVSAAALQHVHMTYQARRGENVLALKDVSLDILPKEFVTIIGPSGCGKSTLIKIIAGLVRPSSGEVLLGSSEVTGPSADVGLVFQQPVLLPWRNVSKNVSLPLEVLDSAKNDRRAAVEQLLDLVGLGKYGKHYPHELSGGMQQRVSIARALVHDPDVLLMDEPFGALDALTRDQMSFELMRIWSERSKTVVFVTHSIPEAILLADRVVVMSKSPGEIAEIIDIELPRPRRNEMVNTPEFGAYVQRARTLLNAETTAH
ncbi:ABC transporter ATP-binding protein [Acrocarpospora macrocephala]|uniref:ABC transporter ATP-binding protein n=1 Tax=Acrocarpospora macrocephala TaxID=150177 RepID=A0A5M3WM57_9ACTN|nr:ABC transporter ATP-binding protein [Acrocarpospora macrocephala]GES09716.1 ABC transporter ATP-binding protein [Acrocarpospora macrocephala]